MKAPVLPFRPNFERDKGGPKMKKREQFESQFYLLLKNVKGKEGK